MTLPLFLIVARSSVCSSSPLALKAHPVPSQSIVSRLMLSAVFETDSSRKAEGAGEEPTVLPI